MSETVVMFANYTLTATVTDAGRLISFGQEWIGLGIRVDAVTGAGAQAVFNVQWSNDNTTWVDDPAPLATVAAAGTYVGRRQIRGLYWRLAAVVTGTQPRLTCSAGAIF